VRGSTAKQEQSPLQWPAGAKVTPGEVGGARYVKGELLNWAWELVNRSPAAPVYASFDGKT